MFTYSKAIVALALELAGLWMLLTHRTESLALVGYFTAHLGASALAALVLTRVLRGPFARHPNWGLGYLFVMCFFLPLVGVFGLLMVAQIGRFRRRPGHSEAFAIAEKPEFAPVSAEVRQIKGKAQARAQLANPKAPVETRLRSLLAMQDLPSRVANPIIRDMLADPSDDIRLVAYGILDSREKSINHRIHALREQLARLGPGDAQPAARLAAERQLAELYWELIYQGLVQGDLRRHAAEQVAMHLAVALELAPEDPVLWALRGRLEVFGGRFREARGAYARAAALGLPEVRVLPYQAEVAFHLRDYARVRMLLARIAETSHTQRMSQVIDFWGSGGAAAR